ncbi:MAG: RES domain-containing protein [Chloroflexota bacterium]
MISVVEVIPPSRPLYRVGRQPDPLVLPPFSVVGSNRFDDPHGMFRVLYVAERQLGCFVETLAPLRASVADIAALSRAAGATIRPVRRIPLDWCQERRIARLRLRAGYRWLDLRAPETCEVLRAELADLLVRLGLTDFDVSGARGPSRALTQHIARWAYEHSFAGIAYRSRFADSLDCWAVFEGDHWESVGRPAPIRRDNPSFHAAAQLLGLTVVT